MADHIIFRVHALRRMFERRIDVDQVHLLLATGEVIEDYPNDTPYPSRLILGWVGSRAIHIVVADNQDAQETIIITAYEPNLREWEPGFRRRKR